MFQTATRLKQRVTCFCDHLYLLIGKRHDLFAQNWLFVIDERKVSIGGNLATSDDYIFA